MISKLLRKIAVILLFTILIFILTIGILALENIITWELFLLLLSVVGTTEAIVFSVLLFIILYLIERGK